jgi:hypothetical protein
LPNAPVWQWNGTAWVQISGGGGGGSGAASGITFAPGGNISATDVQAAILELDTEKAPLASPTFTGDPKAPTPTAGDNDTSIATTAFVTGAVAGVATVPPATVAPIMDSVAAVGIATKYAREDHVHPSDTSRAPLASPALTGTPTAPTATAGTSTTQIATTAFVQTAGAAGSVRYDTAQTLTAAQKAQARANIDSLKKNYIINGGMQISQENGATAGTAAGYYAVDLFVMQFGNAGTQTVQQIASLTPGGSPNRLRVTATVADAAVAAADFCYVGQAIEGLRVTDLKAGSAAAKTVILQFGVKAPAGTYCVEIRNGAPNRCYVAEYTIAAGEANTDVIKQVTLTLDTTGTWATDNTIGITVIWTLMAGTTFQTAPNVWTAGNLLGSANQFNFMGTAGNVFELFDVGLYEGNVAPAFQLPDYATELMLCKRYYEKQAGGRSLIWIGNCSAGNPYGATAPFSVTKRATPTLTALGNLQSLFPVPTPIAANPDYIYVEANASSTGYGYFMCGYVANARL